MSQLELNDFLHSFLEVKLRTVYYIFRLHLQQNTVFTWKIK